MESMSELRPLLRELKAKREEMSGDRNSGCRSSAVIGGSSGGRSSSAGKGGSGGKHSKGGGNKKAGWEDAGLEFYREAYPGALENLYDNSLRTLLPSKRYSVGTLGRGTVRRRSSTRNVRRRRQSSAATTLVHTTRRGSDTYLEVLPDLTQGVDEEETWEKLQQIRMHAVPMREKRELKRQLLSAPTLRTRGFAAIKLSRRKFISRLKVQLKEFISKIGLWKGSLKYVEGNFGTGLVAFFTFIKWLLFLNLFSSTLIMLFIIVPQVLFTQPEDWCNADTNRSESLFFFSSTPSEYSPSLLPEINSSPAEYIITPPPEYLTSPREPITTSTTSTTTTPITTTSTSTTTTTTTTSTTTTTPPPSTTTTTAPLTSTKIKTSPSVLTSPFSSPEYYSSSLLVPASYEPFGSHSPFYAALFSTENQSECCYEKYKEYVEAKDNNYSNLIQLLLDCLQGTGILEISPLFYGYYPRMKFSIKELNGFEYSLPLAYLCVMIFIMALSLILMVRKAAKGLRDSLRSSEGQFYQFSNLVFGGWDYCIENNAAATIKKKAIYNELKNFIETERYKEEEEMRTKRERCRLYFIRLLINLLVVLILVASFVAIYHATTFAFKNLIKFQAEYRRNGRSSRQEDDLLDEEAEFEEGDETVPWWVTLLLEFLPSGTIIALNIIVPYIFKLLVQFEKYTPNFILTLTLIRTIFLRLASLVVLLFTVYQRIKRCEAPPDGQCVSFNSGCSEQIRCWETYVGQQLYKLTLLDLLIMAVNTFLINLPRKILGHKILRGSRIGEAIGSIEFEIPKHVLDIVYGQTLCWLGMFFSPLLPAVTCVKLVLTFYLKYFDCSINTTQSSQLYRTSRSNSLFISILLFSFIVTIIPVGFSIAELKPSVSCGPFFSLPTIWSEIVSLIEDSPQWLQNFLFFLGTAGFAVPTIIILILAGYYYYAVAAANKHMVSLLKHQLVLEGHDKQFLLIRLDKIIKRTQELEEMQRSERSSDFTGEFAMSGNNDLTLDIRGTN